MSNLKRVVFWNLRGKDNRPVSIRVSAEDAAKLEAQQEKGYESGSRLRRSFEQK